MKKVVKVIGLSIVCVTALFAYSEALFAYRFQKMQEARVAYEAAHNEWLKTGMEFVSQGMRICFPVTEKESARLRMLAMLRLDTMRTTLAVAELDNSWWRIRSLTTEQLHEVLQHARKAEGALDDAKMFNDIASMLDKLQGHLESLCVRLGIEEMPHLENQNSFRSRL